MTPEIPTPYTPELGQLICDKIAGSKLGLATLCRREELPPFTTIMRWLGEHDKKDFLLNYQLAREAQADELNDEIIEIADSMDEAKISPAVVVRLRMDARKWKAAKLAPKKYGNKKENDVSGAEDATPVNTVLWGGKELPY